MSNDLYSGSQTYVEVEIVRSQCLEGPLETGLGIILVGVPELRGQEQLASRHAAVPDTLANFIFVAVDSCRQLAHVRTTSICVRLTGQHRCDGIRP